MKRRKARDLYQQFCPECGRSFLRLSDPNGLPVLCGYCRRRRDILAWGNETHGHAQAELAFVKWVAMQESLLRLWGRQDPAAKPQAHEPVAAPASEEPF